MEDDLNVCEREDLNKNNATETMKSKSNGCGTAPGNLVMNNYCYNVVEVNNS